MHNDIFKEYEEIVEEVAVKEYRIVKDKNPILTLQFQIITLIVLIIGLLKNYGFKVDYGILALIIGTSLLVSIYLMLNSENTIFNIVINIFVPSIIYLIYFFVKKNRKST